MLTARRDFVIGRPPGTHSPSLGETLAFLRKRADPSWIPVERRFYRDPDRHVFWGVRKAHVVDAARKFVHLGFDEIRECLLSPVHEVRSLGLRILRNQFDRGDACRQDQIFHFYVAHRQQVSEWDLVDESAPYIAGKYLWKKDPAILFDLSGAENQWDRRIAIVSSWWFIRQGHIDTTFGLVERLFSDREDLIHKACGWMLRETGKVDLSRLVLFLERHHARMPRVMLRYALERFHPDDRERFLQKNRNGRNP
uniref:DNA alkylation repair protein n=1 Tax=Leptospirillum ferriphilum TaxID=178606 RepID=A0A7C3QV59_9BACT